MAEQKKGGEKWRPQPIGRNFFQSSFRLDRFLFHSYERILIIINIPKYSFRLVDKGPEKQIEKKRSFKLADREKWTTKNVRVKS